MKKYLCVGCYNEYNSKIEAETCCGEEAEEINEEDEETDDFEENETELTK